MPIQGGKLKEKVETFDWTYDGDLCSITYRPNVVTLEVIRELRASKGDEGEEALVDVLARTLVKWDVEQDDGTMWPVTGDGLAKLPVPFLGRVMDAIGEHATGDREGN